MSSNKNNNHSDLSRKLGSNKNSNVNQNDAAKMRLSNHRMNSYDRNNFNRYNDDYDDNDDSESMLDNEESNNEPSATSLLGDKLKNSVKNKFGFGKKKDDKDNNKDSNDNDSDTKEDDGSVDKSLPFKIPTVLKVKLGIILIIVFCIAFVVVGISMAFSSIFGFILGGTNKDGGMDNGSTVEVNNAKEYHNELKKYESYYNSSKKCNVSIDINYVDAIVMYKEYMGADLNKGLDYKDATSKIPEVVKIMGNECNVDYSAGGKFYNDLKNSSFFKSYYSDLLKSRDTDSILNDLFYLSDGNMIDGDQETENLVEIKNNKTYVCNDSSVYRISRDNGKIVKSSKIGSLKDYLAGIIYFYMDENEINNPNNLAMMESIVVASTTKLLANATFFSEDCSFGIEGNIENFLSCSTTLGCHFTSNMRSDVGNGGSNKSSGGSINEDDLYYYKKPYVASQNGYLFIDAVNNVYGQVLLTKNGGFYNFNDLGSILRTNNSDYKKILNLLFSGSRLDTAKEDNYTFGVDFGTSKIQHNVTRFRQTDYKDKFCGLSGQTISSSGCGTTSMAIVLNYFVDKKYTPVSVMKEAYSIGACGGGISGTAQSFFKRRSINAGLKYNYVSRNGDLNNVTNALASGNSLVVILVGSGRFTSGGHYMVLSGIDPSTKSVYVVDPYHNVNSTKRKSGDGWYTLSSIAKETRNYFIITKG